MGVLGEEGRWTVWNESLPGHLVSLIPLAMDSSVIMSFRDTEVDRWVEEFRNKFFSHEGSDRRVLITVSAVPRLSSWCAP